MGLRYIASWVDEQDVTQSLEIYDPSYSDDPVDFSDDPIFDAAFNIRYNESPENIKGIGIYNSTATLNAVGDDTIDLADLASRQDREITAIYKKAGVINWMGYCIPDSINWQLDAAPYSYTINFTDGLNLLENLPIFVLNLDPPEDANIRCPLNWFRVILNASSNLGLPLPIEWCMSSLKNEKWLSEDVFAGSVMWGQDERSFLFYNENQSIRRYRSCHYILRNMLVSMHARLFQKGGVWHIERIPDIASGNYTKYRIPASLSGVPVVETIEVNENRVLGEDGWATQGTGSITVKKGLRSVIAKYEHNQSENAWPNGNMAIESLGTVLYWDKYPAWSVTDLIRKDTITQRGENSLQITFVPAVENDQYSGLTLQSDGKYTVPIDTHTLYKRFKWDFTFMPENWPSDAIDDDGYIIWSNSPLKAKVTFAVPKIGGGVKKYVLNEFGFWSIDLEGSSRLVKFYEDTTSGGGTFTTVFRFAGVPISGDRLHLQIGTEVYDYYDYIATTQNEGNLEDYLIGLQSFISTFGTFTYSLDPYIDVTYTDAYQLTISGTVGLVVRNATVFLSDATNLDGTIEFTVPQMKLGDVAKITFQSKTLNDSWILFPDPGDLSGTLATGVSELGITLLCGEYQQIRYQDVTLELDENYDVYQASISGSKNTATEEIVTEISSQFTGLIPSNFQTTFTRSNEQFKFTDGISSGSLTKVLAESILRFNSKSSIVVQDLTFYCENGEFEFGQIYEIPSFEGKKFLTLSAEYNNQKREATITACEIEENDDDVITTIHYGNNEYANSN